MIDWIVDNGCTPHIVLDTQCDGVDVPMEFARDNKLVLNVSGSAVHGFKLNTEGLELHARFGGDSRAVRTPVGAIIGIYARENGQGMSFETETSHLEEKEDDQKETSSLPAHLRLIKD